MDRFALQHGSDLEQIFEWQLNDITLRVLFHQLKYKVVFQKYLLRYFLRKSKCALNNSKDFKNFAGKNTSQNCRLAPKMVQLKVTKNKAKKWKKIRLQSVDYELANIFEGKKYKIVICENVEYRSF